MEVLWLAGGDVEVDVVVVRHVVVHASDLLEVSRGASRSGVDGDGQAALDIEIVSGPHDDVDGGVLVASLLRVHEFEVRHSLVIEGVHASDKLPCHGVVLFGTA